MNNNEIAQENLQLRQNITDLQQSLKQAEQHISLLQSILDNTPSAIYAVDTAGKMLFANRSFENWADRGRNEMVGKTQSELFASELVAEWQAKADQVRETLQSVATEETISSAEGLRTYSSLRFPISDTHGAIYALGGIATDITEQRRAEDSLRASQHLMQEIIDHAPLVIYVKNTDMRLLLVNQLYAATMQMAPDQIVGKTEAELFPPELVHAWRESDRHIFTTGEPTHFENEFLLEDGPHTFMSVQFPLYEEGGKPFAICGISTDVTEIKRSEAEREALQNQVIMAQQAMLHELSTPLIPLDDGVVIMPLIGTVDSIRAQHVMEMLLEGVAAHNAEIAILDVTGLPVVDTQVAQALIKTAQAVKLLGAEVVLTGIRPELAQTLVGLGVDLSAIVTRSSLQDGVTYALKQL